jgi:sulfite exporter TauE/SafE
LLGLAGSLHCLGMCGPLVVLFHNGLVRGRNHLAPVLLYHGGRIAVYVLLGVLCGQIGYLLNFTGYQKTLSITLGILLLITAILGMIKPGWLSQVWRPLQSWLQSKSLRGGRAGWLLMGMVNGLLPCGLVLAALATALQPGSWWMGAAAMAVFGLGTMPALLAAGCGSRVLRRPGLKPIVRIIMPMLIIATGTWLVVRGIPESHSCCENEILTSTESVTP